MWVSRKKMFKGEEVQGRERKKGRKEKERKRIKRKNGNKAPVITEESKG